MADVDQTAWDNIRDHQRQLDADGCEVGVSRQAIDETLTHLAALTAENDRLRQDQVVTGDLRTKLKTGIAAIDAATADCPIRSGKERHEVCPKCYATSSQNCGPNISATDKLVMIVREIMDMPAVVPSAPNSNRQQP